MSTGRYSQRGFAFQSFAFRTWALAGGGADAVTDPVDGWIAGARTRLVVAETRDRVMVSETRNRVWIARDK